MSIPYYSDIDLNGNLIKNSGKPVDLDDVVNKSYVDTTLEKLNADLITLNTETKNDLESKIQSEIETIDTKYTKALEDMSSSIDDLIIGNVEDNLSSTSSTKSLSANQGNVLNNKINNIPINFYSSVETKIGYWEEYNIYRKLITNSVTTPKAYYDIQLSDIATENIEIIDISGFYTIDNNRKWLSKFIPAQSEQETVENIKYGIYVCGIDISTNTVHLYIGSETLNEITNQDITLIIDYKNTTI